MRRKKIYLFLVLFLIICSAGFSQTINTRFSTYFYSWNRYDSIGTNSPSTTHIRGYQNLLFDVSYKKWSFNTSVQVEEDVTGKVDRGFGYRFYNVYLKGSNLWNALDLKLGRQYVSVGAGRSTVDGIYAKLKLGKDKEFQLTGFGGMLTPLTYDFDYGKQKLSENFAVGAMFSYYGVRDLMLGVSYFNRHRKPVDYFGTRIDSAFINPQTVLVETAPYADQLVGFDGYYSKKNYSVLGKAYFDINNKKFYKGEVYGSYNVIPEVKLSLGYNYREPQISYNTIFWVFEHKQYQEIEGGVDYIWKNYNFFGRVSNVIFKDDKSFKFSLGISHPAYGISFTKYTGYSGESDGLYGYFNYPLLNNNLTLTSSVGYSNYKINNYSDERSGAFSGLLGLVWRPSPYISFDAQGQLLTNRIYKTDTRFLIGFNYWLFNKY